MKSVYLAIINSAVTHPYQRAIAKLSFEEQFIKIRYGATLAMGLTFPLPFSAAIKNKIVIKINT